MSAAARAEGSRGVRAQAGLYREAKQALRSLCPQPLLNWREARFHGRYGEVELHLLKFLCRRDRDAIDVGANDGSYVHYLRRHARQVIAFEPTPRLANALRQKFGHSVRIEPVALSDSAGTVELRMPMVDGVTAHEAIEVKMATLDSVYDGDVGFIKIDVEGREQAVLDGAVQTIGRCRPRLLVEIDERLSPGGLARAKDYFKRLDYTGYFVHSGFIEPIATFSPDMMQRPRHLPDLKAPLQQRQRFGRYVYNFIFLPRDEPRELIERMTQRLTRL